MSAVTGEPADALGVKKGWILSDVAGEETPGDKAAVAKMIMKVCLTDSAYQVVLQKSIPAQICQLILHISNKLTDLCWN